ncbi:DUF805 domain-containing protein [Spiroplasma floricola]|uniref:DUF805 domain-containing protein n=1 Tax=Spiroplasma floricola 23-6 TaxID=1336749 RepID=A0A2K8SE76_9MOLU|nr:hypothetical protein [Spiroplasma floricola]AUB31767.1 hypothetical protein SFLOR_v1c07190 [Spiroplasma floricola 23-6]
MDYGLELLILVTNCRYNENDLNIKKIDRRAFRDFFSFNMFKIIVISLCIFGIYDTIKFKKESLLIFTSVILGFTTISLIINCLVLTKNLFNILKREDINKPKWLFISLSFFPILNFIALVIFYIVFQKSLRKKDYKFISLNRNPQNPEW